MLRLDKYRCRHKNCGATENLEVHHIIGRGAGGPDEEWNLITLCPKHHREITERKKTNIDLLKPLLKKGDFRWQKAYEYHLNKEKLRRLCEK